MSLHSWFLNERNPLYMPTYLLFFDVLVKFRIYGNFLTSYLMKKLGSLEHTVTFNVVCTFILSLFQASKQTIQHH